MERKLGLRVVYGEQHLERKEKRKDGNDHLSVDAMARGADGLTWVELKRGMSEEVMETAKQDVEGFGRVTRELAMWENETAIVRRCSGRLTRPRWVATAVLKGATGKWVWQRRPVEPGGELGAWEKARALSVREGGRPGATESVKRKRYLARNARYNEKRKRVM